MTAVEFTQVLVGVGTLVTTIGSVIASLSNGRKIHAVETKAAVIEAHVNSEKTAAQGREAALRSENQLLRESITDLKATAGLLAQAQATPTPAAPAQVEVVNSPNAPVPTMQIAKPSEAK